MSSGPLCLRFRNLQLGSSNVPLLCCIHQRPRCYFVPYNITAAAAAATPPASRSYSLSTAQTVTLPTRANHHGSITLDIHHPVLASPPHARDPGTSSSVVIYLPSGLISQDAKHGAAEDQAIVTALRSALPHPIVKLNFTSASKLQYPNAVHEVLTGFDWVIQHLLPKRAITRPGRPAHFGQIAVLGQHVGGALAAMLALTECRTGETGVVAAAVNDPLLDWVSLGSAADQDDVVSKRAFADDVGFTPAALLRLRSLAFRQPQHYFDPFASPMLFLRSAGAVVPPPSQPPLDDLDQLSLFEREDFFRQQQALSAVTVDPDPVSQNLEQGKVVKRKASRNYPSKALGLRLPCFHISSGDESCLHGQASEFTKLLRKSVVRQSVQATSFGRKALTPGEEDQMEEEERLQMEAMLFEAERKVQFVNRDDPHPWDIGNVISWMKQVL